MSDFQTTTIRRARKEHRCGECGRTIARGERYCLTAGSWDGHMSTFKGCQHCDILRRTIGSRDDFFYEESYFGGLAEYNLSDLAETALDELDHLALLRLWVGFRRGWQNHATGETVPIPYIARCVHQSSWDYEDGPNGEPAQGEVIGRWFWLDSTGAETDVPAGRTPRG